MAAADLVRLSPTDIEQRPWVPVTACAGVRAKELWRLGDAVDALIAYDPGAATPGVPHHGGHHHIWVIAGSVAVAGRRLSTGSYVYVPPGAAHPIDQVGEQGCILLQVHRPAQDQPAGPGRG